MKTKLQLKKAWRKYLAENKDKSKTIGNHHYFRSRYASSFWLKEMEMIYKDYKEVFRAMTPKERPLTELL